MSLFAIVHIVAVKDSEGVHLDLIQRILAIRSSRAAAEAAAQRCAVQLADDLVGSEDEQIVPHQCPDHEDPLDCLGSIVGGYDLLSTVAPWIEDGETLWPAPLLAEPDRPRQPDRELTPEQLLAAAQAGTLHRIGSVKMINVTDVA